MSTIDATGRWKCEAPGCNAPATHEYFWLGRPTVACVLHMETAVELAKTVNYREVEATMRAIPPDKALSEVVKA